MLQRGIAALACVAVLGTAGGLRAQTKRELAELLALKRKADALEAKGEYAAAAKLSEQLVEQCRRVFGAQHRVTAASMNGLANLYKAMGQYGKAEPLYKRSVEIWVRKLGKDHPNVATSLNNLAGLYYSMGRYGEAEPLYKRSLEIWEAKLGKDHADVAATLHNLAALYESMGQYGKAEPLYKRSLEIRQSKLGKHHPDVAATLHNLAGLYQDMGQYGKAEPLYKRSLEITESKLGKDHPNVAHSLHNLAALYQLLGRYGKAEPLYKRSLKIKEAKLGKDHPDVALSLNNLAALYGSLGQYGKAVAFTDRARRTSRGHVARVLPALSEREQLTFLRTKEEGAFQIALSLGLSRSSDSATAARSAAWLLNGKGVAQEALAQPVLLTRASKSPATRQLHRQLAEVRQQLAQLTFATPRPGQEKQRLRQIQELTEQEEDLAKKLRRAGSAVTTADWVELDSLRKALPHDAVLIDIARFDVFNPKAKPGKRWQPARYAAWITAPRGAVRIVDLGAADKVDAAVKQLREALKAAPALLKARGEAQAEKALREPLEALSRLVLHPLLRHVGKVQGWLISPDGNLWLVPWAALTLPGGKFAIEEHRISYVVSGRDLLAPAGKVKPRAALVLADPDFDLKARRLPRPGAGTPERLRSAGLGLGRVPRLPWTAAEAKAVAPRLKKYTGAAPHVYLADRAVEKVFKSARNPRVVVFSTHGFTLADQERKPAEGTRGLEAPARLPAGWENPCCAAGCCWQAATTPARPGATTAY
jgi:tetratricopeptide (TPR) repeat protein